MLINQISGPACAIALGALVGFAIGLRQKKLHVTAKDTQRLDFVLDKMVVVSSLGVRNPKVFDQRSQIDHWMFEHRAMLDEIDAKYPRQS